MRLTPNAVLDAPSYLNAAGERALVLRDLKVPILENLSVVGDIHQALDLVNNDLKILGNFPVMTRLKTLIVAKNRISLVQEDLVQFIPNLESLSLVSNTFTNLSALKPLAKFKHLKNLYLLDNKITHQEHYRLAVIWLLPSLQILDFHKVKQSQRNEAIKLFGTIQEPSLLAKQLLSVEANSNEDKMDTETETIQKVLKKLTDEDRERLKQELRNATSLSEIDRIENALKSGYL